jgi:hypothetical protein
VSKAYPKVAAEEDRAAEGLAALERASKLSVAEQAARFAGAAITGRGYVIGGRDWGKMLDRWKPRPLEAGDSVGATLQPFGIVGAQLTSPATVALEKGTDATLFTVIDNGSKTVTEVVRGGRTCLDPKPGQQIYVGAVRATTKGTGATSIDASRATC